MIPAPPPDAAAAPRLLVGTSGFSYDDWRGPFYPPRLARADMLDFYAEVFPALEINATYYRTPPPETAAGLVRRAAGRLVFAVKAPGALTHDRRLDAEVLLPWRRFVAPFEEAGVLAAVLLQFPGGFHAGAATWRFLEAARAALAPLPLVVELRHASWDAPGVGPRLAGAGVSRALLDQPDGAVRGLSRSGAPPPVAAAGRDEHAAAPPRAAPRLAYARFHGRNAAAWHGDAPPPRSGAARDDRSPAARAAASARYLYRYTAAELRPWVAMLRAAAEGADSALAFFNNHPRGNAVADARAFAAMAGVALGTPAQDDLFAAPPAGAADGAA